MEEVCVVIFVPTIVCTYIHTLLDPHTHTHTHNRWLEKGRAEQLMQLYGGGGDGCTVDDYQV